MSWSRRALLMLLVAPLWGCGFHPLYGGRMAGEYDPELASIKVAPIPDRQGQMLAQSLRERLNPRGVSLPVRYTLTVDLVVTRSDLGIQRDATSLRAEINAIATYRLQTTVSGPLVFSGHTHSVSAFNILPDGYATQVAENDARERAISEVSDELITSLSAFVKARREAAR